jgi:hypothetical protein
MTTHTSQNPNTPMSRLPRAAERSTHAWEAHRDKDPALDAQGATMVAAAEQYRAAQTVHHDRQTQAAVKRQHRTVARYTRIQSRRWTRTKPRRCTR